MVLPLGVLAQDFSNYTETTFSLTQELYLKDVFLLDPYDFQNEIYDTLSITVEDIDEDCTPMISAFVNQELTTISFSPTDFMASLSPSDSVRVIVEYGLQIQHNYIFRITVIDQLSNRSIYLCHASTGQATLLPSGIKEDFDFIITNLNANGFFNVYNQRTAINDNSLQEVKMAAHSGEGGVYFTLDALVDFFNTLPEDARNELLIALNARIY